MFPVYPMTPELMEFFQRAGRKGGKKGGAKGGTRAALNMTPAERAERARKASRARWDKQKRKKS